MCAVVARKRQYLIVFNKQGKTRLAKWYVPYEDEERKKLILELYRLVNSRDQKFTNFVEVRARACARFWRAFL